MRHLLLTILLLSFSVTGFAGAKMRADYTDYCQDATAKLCARMNGTEITGDTLVDLSPNALMGTITAKSVVTGKEGTALDFVDASDTKVYYGDTTTIDGETELSICAWIKLDALNVGRNIVSKWGNTTALQSFIFSVDPGASDELRYAFYNGSTYLVVDSTNANLTTDTWCHACVTYKANQDIDMYLNGEALTVSVGSANNITSVRNSTGPLVIGHIASSSTDGINGIIDEVLIIAKQLTPTEILDIYTNGLK